VFNVFDVPNGYLLENFCKVRARCFNSAFIKLLAKAVFSSLDSAKIYFGNLRLNNLYYDADEDKIVFVNLYDNPKPVPSTFVKPDISDDLVDFGILLIQLTIR